MLLAHAQLCTRCMAHPPGAASESRQTKQWQPHVVIALVLWLEYCNACASQSAFLCCTPISSVPLEQMSIFAFDKQRQASKSDASDADPLLTQNHCILVLQPAWPVSAAHRATKAALRTIKCTAIAAATTMTGAAAASAPLPRHLAPGAVAAAPSWAAHLAPSVCAAPALLNMAVTAVTWIPLHVQEQVMP